jgi:hypothetical protein
MERYPLTWPTGWKRTLPGHRVRSKFGQVNKGTGLDGVPYKAKSKVRMDDAFDRIEEELERIGVDLSTVIVSTNLPTNLRGLPQANQGEPSDPGVAVYWTHKKKPQCMAIDRYFRVADNIAAVAATLYAMRAIERHGGAQIMERVFIGFAQLPVNSSPPWRDVLQFHAAGKVSLDMVQTAYRALAAKRHPDVGGSEESFTELVQARDAALRELSEKG